MVNGENPHVGFDFYVDTIGGAARGDARRAPQVLHGERDPPHDDALRAHARAGAARAQGGRARLAAGRRRRGLRRPRAAARRARQGAPGLLVPAHGTAHRLGIPTHCTMLYGHVETYEERVDHLLRLREQQDETGGFLAFIPLAFHPENTVFERRGWRHTAGADDLKMIAVSRLLLDNVPNVKAYWIMMGMPLAAVALHFGANDVQGTVVREEIFHAAGARTETEQKIDELVRFVQRGRPHPGAARHALQRAAALVSWRRGRRARPRAVAGRARRRGVGPRSTRPARLETRWPPPIRLPRGRPRAVPDASRRAGVRRLQQEQIRRDRGRSRPGPPRLAGALYDLAAFTWRDCGLEVTPDDAKRRRRGGRALPAAASRRRGHPRGRDGRGRARAADGVCTTTASSRVWRRRAVRAPLGGERRELAQRGARERPALGAESFIAGYRELPDRRGGVDELSASSTARGRPPVSKDGVDDTIRRRGEFATLDLDGNARHLLDRVTP